jgi:hypothetical protein
VGKMKMKTIEIAREKVNKGLAKLDSLKLMYGTEKDNLKRETIYLSNVKEAQNIAQHISQAIQQQAHNQIAGAVSICLELVFGKGVGFKINFERKRNRTEAVLTILKDGREEIDPLNQDSGGIVEVAAFALRLSCICLSKPNVRKVMILDEPFKSVHSLEYRENVGMMLQQLSEDFGVQIIMVTGIEEYKIGKVIEL